MSNVIPQPKMDYLLFCQTHITPWTDHAAAIGLTAPMVEAWKSLYTEAQASWNAAKEAREAAKGATMVSDQNIALSRASTAELVRLIKNYALTQNDPMVYALAQIPAPLPPSSLPPPAQPTDLRAALNTEDGSLTVRWKANNAKGVTSVVYYIRRRIGLAGAWEPVSAVGGRVFTDDTVPAGSAIVQYQVQGQRGTQLGPVSATMTIFFGVGGGFIAKTEYDETPTSAPAPAPAADFNGEDGQTLFRQAA